MNLLKLSAFLADVTPCLLCGESMATARIQHRAGNITIDRGPILIQSGQGPKHTHSQKEEEEEYGKHG